jgi:hypothetical protein
MGRYRVGQLCLECMKREARLKFCSRTCSQRYCNRKWINLHRAHYQEMQRRAYIRKVIRQSEQDMRDSGWVIVR